MSQLKTADPIGVFDSGVGGLSIFRAMRASMSAENVIYFGDQGHVPYGSRPMEQIQAFSEAITNFLLARGAKLIVVACNTASAAALKYLRAKFSDVSFVGMEPAVKPAAEYTHSGVIGVLATPATFQGALYASVVERFAGNVQVLQDTCPGLVAQIEQCDLNGPRTRDSQSCADTHAGSGNRHSCSGMHALSVCYSADSRDRWGKRSGDRPGSGSGAAGSTSA